MAQWLTIDHESWFLQFNKACPLVQLEWGRTIRMIDSSSWSQKSQQVEVIVDHTCRSNNMVDMEAPLSQNLTREAHPTSIGNHGTLGSPHCLPSWIIWRYSRRNIVNIQGMDNLHFEIEWNVNATITRRQYTMVLPPAEMALPNKDSPHATSPHHPWTVEGFL